MDKLYIEKLVEFVRELAELPVEWRYNNDDYADELVCGGCGSIQSKYNRIPYHSPDCIAERARELLGLPLRSEPPVICPKCGEENWGNFEVWVGTDEEFEIYESRFDAHVIGDLKLFHEYEELAKPYAKLATGGCWSCAQEYNRQHMSIMGLVFRQAAALGQSSNRPSWSD